MKLVYHSQRSIPRLAWCAVLRKGSPEVHVYHGTSVEVQEAFFVEGAWDGDFTRGLFDQSSFFLGTGGKLLRGADQRGVVFATPSHTLERLWSISSEDCLFVSNSLPFILSMSRSSLDITYLYYERDLNSILKGINSYVRTLPLLGKRELRVHYYCNVFVDSTLALTEFAKPRIEPFRDYEHYLDAMISTLRRLVKNAQAPQRKVRYGLCSTISRGYDAPACAAIARELGCDLAVSFNHPEKYIQDCGVDIASRLGYAKVVTKSAVEYLQNESLIEAEFMASGELGTLIVFSAFEREFRDNIVFMGIRGGRMWGKNEGHPNHELRFENQVFSSTSATENRLRVGYIMLPMALFGATQWPSIHRISNSPEMAPFSIGGDYDRPIPRRILESRGVERSMFAQRKTGAGFNFRWDNLRRIRRRMSPPSFASFMGFLKDHKHEGQRTFRQWAEFLWDARTQYVAYAFSKVGIPYKAKTVTADAYPNPGAASYLFHWGVHEMMKRYSDVELGDITSDLCEGEVR